MLVNNRVGFQIWAISECSVYGTFGLRQHICWLTPFSFMNKGNSGTMLIRTNIQICRQFRQKDYNVIVLVIALTGIRIPLSFLFILALKIICQRKCITSERFCKPGDKKRQMNALTSIVYAHVNRMSINLALFPLIFLWIYFVLCCF